jgi:hypothetical protein
MRAMPWVVLGVLIVLAVYLSWTAGRLDRLHARVEAARAALDAQLVRRSSVALEMATSGLLDPATAMVLAGSAHEAREVGPDEQELAESDLSRALRAVLDQPGQPEELRSTPEGRLLLRELDAASRRVVMARRFHNDAVRATQAVRRKRVVRYLRLAGHAAMPPTFESDDEPPRCLAREL